MRLIKIVVISIFLGFLVRAFLFEGIYVASGSMEPTLFKGKYYILQRVSYYFNQPQRGDIVAFPSPVKNGKDLIKRIIALPNEELQIKYKIVFINGSPLRENYVKYTRENELLKGDNLGPLIVPQGKVFVMGDNRDESFDSRDWDDPVTKEKIYFVDIKDIEGKITLFY